MHTFPILCCFLFSRVFAACDSPFQIAKLGSQSQSEVHADDSFQRGHILLPTDPLGVGHSSQIIGAILTNQRFQVVFVSHEPANMISDVGDFFCFAKHAD